MIEELLVDYLEFKNKQKKYLEIYKKNNASNFLIDIQKKMCKLSFESWIQIF